MKTHKGWFVWGKKRWFVSVEDTNLSEKSGRQEKLGRVTERHTWQQESPISSSENLVGGSLSFVSWRLCFIVIWLAALISQLRRSQKVLPVTHLFVLPCIEHFTLLYVEHWTMHWYVLTIELGCVLSDYNLFYITLVCACRIIHSCTATRASGVCA